MQTESPTARTTVSLVTYRHRPETLLSLFETLQHDRAILTWVLVDNSAADDPVDSAQLRLAVERHEGIYVASPGNIGFGAAHNLALRELAHTASEFHLILNPDIAFTPDVLPTLAQTLDRQHDTGLVMPRIFYPDGATQHLCKLLPTPLDFLLRRFTPRPLQRLLRERMERYELRVMDPTQPAEIPFLSGCFMFTRRAVLEAVQGFDERYFLYMEDVDLCRRMATRSKLLYWPFVAVVHVHERGSHKHLKLTLIHLRSAIVYFNRWGWFVDDARTRVNRAALAQWPRCEYSDTQTLST